VSTTRTVIGSVARIADFSRHPPEVMPVDRSAWRTGDYVVGEMIDATAPFAVEGPDGAAVPLQPGDRLIGALGRRAATLEIVGDWTEVGDDLVLDTLTIAGVLGRVTSAAVDAGPIARLRYLGHAAYDGEPQTMTGSVEPVAPRTLDVPTVLIIGTSMAAGKTVSAVAIVRELKALGLRVAGTKVSGVGRYRDTLAMRDAGADFIADFVDAGLPSTAVPRSEYEPALATLASKLAAAEPDVLVAEAGASPLEPYNADVAVELLEHAVQLTVLCASDPYAVVGVMQAFGTRPDLVSGRATSTEAGRALVDRLVGIPSLNMLEEANRPALRRFLVQRLGLADPGAATAGASS
jgi:hypothetical protein